MYILMLICKLTLPETPTLTYLKNQQQKKASIKKPYSAKYQIKNLPRIS